MPMSKPLYHVASFSGGKDNTAMVLRMIELGYHIDEVMFCDTTMEFPATRRWSFLRCFGTSRGSKKSSKLRA